MSGADQSGWDVDLSTRTGEDVDLRIIMAPVTHTTDPTPDVDLDSQDEGSGLLIDERIDLEDPESGPVFVTFASQDFPVDGLVKRLESGAILVPQFRGEDPRVELTGFQRGFVWSKGQMDRFIESLLLGYPIPGIFLVKQAEDNRLLVLDGQQRLETLRRFYSGIHDGKVFQLTNVGQQFIGNTYHDLPESDRFKLDDSYMQATIVAADGTSEVEDAIFQIFERLNSGGTQLTAHEIRVALSAGVLMSSIEKLNTSAAWRQLYGEPSRRIRDHELVTRILALYLNSINYRRPLKKFLNDFSAEYRDEQIDLSQVGELFLAASAALATEVGPSAFRRGHGSQVNAAQAEAVMVALMEAASKSCSPDALADRISRLQNDDEFVWATTRATADNERVEKRLARARAFICEHE